ncbi:MAG: hypothetical protein ACPGLV_09475 [Bacteroidia bacterium]
MPKAIKVALVFVFTLTTLISIAKPVHTVKFYKYGCKILFNAYIQDSNKITVLFDPGTYAYMHSGTAQHFKIEYSETGTMNSMGSSRELNLFENFKVDFEGYSHKFDKVKSQATAPYLKKRIDMVFGKEWADVYLVEVNYEFSEIRLYEKKDFVLPQGYKKLEVINWQRYPLVKSWIVFDNGDSGQFNMELNLGTEVGFQLDKWATKKYKLHKVQKDRGHIRIFGADGRGLEGMLTRVKSVQVHDMRKTMVRGGVFENGYSDGNGEFVNGIIGQDFLQWYNIILDRWGETVYYKPLKME